MEPVLLRSTFVDTTTSNLASFSRRCQSAAPAPPPESGGAATYQGPDQYVDVTFSVSGADVGSAKKLNRFETNFRSDLAEALSIDPFSILIRLGERQLRARDRAAGVRHAGAEPAESITSQATNPSSALRSASAAGHTVTRATGSVITQQAAPSGSGFTTSASSPLGHVHISVDNSYTLYINGEELGSGDDWSHTDSYDFSASCGGDLVVAFHGVDAGGPAAGIVSVEHCGTNIVSNHNWRCTASEPGDGWFAAGFQEDSSWEIPAHGGRNGVPPWGHRPGLDVPNANGMQVPSWIWTSDFQGTDEVWCRYDANYDASHFEGANGLGNGGWGQGHMVADDEFTLYINGEHNASPRLAGHESLHLRRRHEPRDPPDPLQPGQRLRCEGTNPAAVPDFWRHHPLRPRNRNHRRPLEVLHGMPWTAGKPKALTTRAGMGDGL